MFSSDTHLPQLAFAHLCITGENTAPGKEGGYQHVMDLDCCRAELTGDKWGIPVVYLPEFQFSGFSFCLLYGMFIIVPRSQIHPDKTTRYDISFQMFFQMHFITILKNHNQTVQHFQILAGQDFHH